MQKSVWNDRVDDGYKRQVNVGRPWYDFAERLVAGLHQSDVQALDVGCGLGEFLDRLSARGYQCTGYDGERSYVEGLSERGMSGSVVNLEDGLPGENGSFGLVSMLEVVEHVARAEPLLADVFRLLEPGGYFVVSTPNVVYWRNRLSFLFGADLPGEGTHLRFFSRARLRGMLIRAGFEVVEEAHFGPLTGANVVRSVLGKTRLDVRIPSCVAGWLAYNLLFLARRPCE